MRIFCIVPNSQRIRRRAKRTQKGDRAAQQGRWLTQVFQRQLEMPEVIYSDKLDLIGRTIETAHSDGGALEGVGVSAGLGTGIARSGEIADGSFGDLGTGVCAGLSDDRSELGAAFRSREGARGRARRGAFAWRDCGARFRHSGGGVEKRRKINTARRDDQSGWQQRPC